LKLTLDTNVLVYATDPRSGDRHVLAKALIGRVSTASTILTMQALGEFFNVMTRKVRVPAAAARTTIAAWRRLFDVTTADEAAYDLAFAACEQHSLSFWDALLWATAMRAGCTTILTEDFQDGRSLGGVTFLNPFDPRNARRLDRVLPKL
jgi:predicted nucleic acid-binding protein